MTAFFYRKMKSSRANVGAPCISELCNIIVFTSKHSVKYPV